MPRIETASSVNALFPNTDAWKTDLVVLLTSFVVSLASFVAIDAFLDALIIGMFVLGAPMFVIYATMLLGWVVGVYATIALSSKVSNFIINRNVRGDFDALKSGAASVWNRITGKRAPEAAGHTIH